MIPCCKAQFSRKKRIIQNLLESKYALSLFSKMILMHWKYGNCIKKNNTNFFFCIKDVSSSLHSFCNHILFTYLSFVFLSFIPSALSSFGSICSPGRVCGSSWQDSGVPAGRSEVEPINLMTINDLRLASMIYNQGESFTARTTRQTRWQRPKCNDLESQAAAPWNLQWKSHRSFLNWEKNREFIIGGCNDDDDEEVEVTYLAKSPPPLPRQIRSNFRVAACLFATFICQ